MVCGLNRYKLVRNLVYRAIVTGFLFIASSITKNNVQSQNLSPMKNGTYVASASTAPFYFRIATLSPMYKFMVVTYRPKLNKRMKRSRHHKHYKHKEKNNKDDVVKYDDTGEGDSNYVETGDPATRNKEHMSTKGRGEKVDAISPAAQKLIRDRKKYKYYKQKIKARLKQIEIDEKRRKRVDCRKRPCENGGTCVATPPSRYRCFCMQYYGGDNCEIELKQRRHKTRGGAVKIGRKKVVVKIPKSLLVVGAAVGGVTLFFALVFCCLARIRMERARAPYREKLARGEPITNLPPGACDSCWWACKTVLCCGCCTNRQEDPFEKIKLSERSQELVSLLPTPESLQNLRSESDAIHRTTSSRAIRSETLREKEPSELNQSQNRSARGRFQKSRSVGSFEKGSSNRRTGHSATGHDRKKQRTKRMRSASVSRGMRDDYDANENNERGNRSLKRTRAEVTDAYDLDCREGLKKTSYVVNTRDEGTVKKVIEYLKQTDTMQSDTLDSSSEAMSPRSPIRRSRHDAWLKPTNSKHSYLRGSCIPRNGSNNANRCEVRGEPHQGNCSHCGKVFYDRRGQSWTNSPRDSVPRRENSAFTIQYRGQMAQTTRDHTDVTGYTPIARQDHALPTTSAAIPSAQATLPAPYITPQGSIHCEYQTIQQNYPSTRVNLGYPSHTQLPPSSNFYSPPSQFASHQPPS